VRGSFLIAPVTFVAACAEPKSITCGEPAYYRVDHVDLPESSKAELELGLDLDGDGNVDDAYGSALTAFGTHDSYAPPMSRPASARLAADVTWEVAVSTCDDGTQHVELGNSGGGDTIPVTLLADPSGEFAPVVWSRVSGLVARVGEADGAFDAVVGFGIPMPDDQMAFAMPLAAFFTGELAAEGPSSFASLFDRDPQDGVVTPQEVLNNSLFETVLEPDLTLDGKTYLSAGMHVHATRVP
jgi:hypothetical protein